MRKELELTQQKFADCIGTTANVLTNYETGRRNPSSSVINNICKTFNVNEEWLRTGEGEMFADEPDTVLDALAAKYNLSRDARTLVEEFVSLKPDVQQVFVDYALKVARSIANEADDSDAIEQNQLPELTDKSAEPDNEDEYDPEARAQAEEYYRELILEKRARTSRASTYGNAG